MAWHGNNGVIMSIIIHGENVNGGGVIRINVRNVMYQWHGASCNGMAANGVM
jgi:hypothetical protein